MSAQNSRRADRPIDPIFLERWSRRALSDGVVEEEELATLFEAARWAPSARNAQPWRFLYAQPGDAAWPVFLDLIYPRNRVWAERAQALVLLASTSRRTEEGKIVDWRTHAFDAGAAWACLALQAARLGLTVRAMGGFDFERTPDAVGLPTGLIPQVMLAVGRPGAADVLPDHLASLETPTDRAPRSDFVVRGLWPPERSS